MLPKISKLSLLLIFVKIEAEKIEFKDTKGQFQFSHYQVILSQSKKEVSKSILIVFSFIQNSVICGENITDHGE